MQRLLLLAALALAACGGEGQDPAPADSDIQASTDTQQSDTAAASDTGDTAPFFELGNNTTGKSTPEHFFPLPDNAKLNVELGPQGLWMVVLAFRTRNLLNPPMILTGRVEMDGKLLGELKLGKQKLLKGPKGLSYYYNFFLVVAPEGVDNKAATITFIAEDDGGEKVNLKKPVVLTGGN